MLIDRPIRVFWDIDMLNKLSSSERAVVKKLVIKYASQKHEASLGNSILKAVQSAAIIVGGLTAFQESALASEGLVVDVGYDEGHPGFFIGTPALRHLVGHHDVDTIGGERHNENPIGGVHHMTEYVKNLSKKLVGLRLKDPEGKLLTEAKLMQGIKTQVQLAEQKLQDYPVKGLLTLNLTRPKSEGSGGSDKTNPPPPVKTVRG